jgi:PIN domain-containing protein
VAKARKKHASKMLLFVDTNIWLDFYRAGSDASLLLLGHMESPAVRDRLIVTFQLEMEYKKNRQGVILAAMKVLTSPPKVPRLGLFSNAAAFATAEKALKQAESRVSKLKKQLARVLETPITHDPVYQACQRLFHRDSSLVLTRENPVRRQIKRRALRRFLSGCPPRKPGDTSMGDAINWEWMIECANAESAGLVIVSRDSDYGVDFEGKHYLNEHLRHEFSDRVSQQRKVVLCRLLSEALKHFNVAVTAAEVKEEKQLVETEASSLTKGGLLSAAEAAIRQQLIEEQEVHMAARELARQVEQMRTRHLLQRVFALQKGAGAAPAPATGPGAASDGDGDDEGQDV